MLPNEQSFPVEFIADNCRDFGLELDGQAKQRLCLYSRLLIEWNQKINLTAITEPAEIAEKHFLDSLMLLKFINIPQNARLIDVGTGAGFPGMVLKIARPDIKLTLVDSLNKRVTFLKELSAHLGLETEIIHARAEELGSGPLYRDSFDIATARAVAQLNVLCEYCLPFVKPGGSFLALKGPDPQEEVDGARNAIKILSGGLSAIHSYVLPASGGRTIVDIKKISQTPPKYPRVSAKILKKPL
ncbi:MAG TPA: 16S rRNA (guanine(527)-N(7))-methyltransferase RsmG [Clostridiales bacterium]|nr:16S rRNA (guanine(527)-N(7))-methyltransferase RsmG [Clostridiales bacterium]